jgi:hypothetical protein
MKVVTTHLPNGGFIEHVNGGLGKRASVANIIHHRKGNDDVLENIFSHGYIKEYNVVGDIVRYEDTSGDWYTYKYNSVGQEVSYATSDHGQRYTKGYYESGGLAWVAHSLGGIECYPDKHKQVPRFSPEGTEVFAEFFSAAGNPCEADAPLVDRFRQRLGLMNIGDCVLLSPKLATLLQIPFDDIFEWVHELVRSLGTRCAFTADFSPDGFIFRRTA